jgi:hypothetical protein
MPAYKGVFTSNDTQIRGLGFQPKVVLFWAAYNTADGRTNGPGRFSWGAAADDGGTVTQGYACLHSLDNQAAAVDARGLNTTACLKGLIAAATTVTVDFELDFGSFVSDGFDVVWTDPPATAGIKVHFLALGGSDVERARVGSFTTTTLVATQNVTVAAGFGRPNLVFAACIGNTSTLGDAAEDAWLSLGCYSVGSSAARNTVLWDNDTSAAQTVGMHQDANLISSYNASTFAIEMEATLTASQASWPTDGFQVSYTDQAAATNPVVYVAVKGSFSNAVGIATTQTTLNGTSDFNAGFAPTAALTWGFNMPASTAIYMADSGLANLGTFGIGGYDGTREGCAGVSFDDGNATMQTGNWHCETKGWWAIDPNATVGNPPDLLGEADTSFSGNNVRYTWTDADEVGRQHNVLALAFVTTGFSLDAAPGTYALTGSVAAPLSARQVNALPGIYDTTGAVTALSRGFVVNAVPGTYSLTGPSAGVLATRFVNSAPGSYAVTGNAAGLLADHLIVAAPGVYTLTGAAADLVYGSLIGAFVLGADPGSYALTGAASSLLAPRFLNCAAGEYVLTGSAATIASARLVVASPGSYALTGTAASLLVARTLNVTAGAYTLSGTATGHLTTRLILAAPGAYALTGLEANLVTQAANVPGEVSVTEASEYALTAGEAGQYSASNSEGGQYSATAS